MKERTKSLMIYAAKCVTGTLIVSQVSSYLDYKDFPWALLSILLILSPDVKDSVSLAFTRIKANIIASIAGLLCLLISPSNMWSISAALVISMSLCYLFKLDAGIRSALAASVIIMLHQEGKHFWDTALERVFAVLIGCFLGLAITYLFHFKSKSNEKRKNNYHLDE